METFFWVLGSVFAASFISLIGVTLLALKEGTVKKYLFFLVALAAGTLLGDAFIHLIPEAFESAGEMSLGVSFSVLLGIVSFFFLEKFLHWHHHHTASHEHEIQSFGYVNLFGDALHNFLDGVLIAGSYLISVPLGITTSIAVILHEIPQELSDFGVLLAAGFSWQKAILFNFISALMAVAGALSIIFLGELISEGLKISLIAFTAGAFTYISATDLFPQMHKEKNLSTIAVQSLFYCIGIIMMVLLLALE